MRVALVLHNIRSAHNVGSIFRTADAAGVTAVHLSGYTPKPADRFGRAQKEIAKTALGAETTVLWEAVSTPIPLIKRLRAQGWRVVGIEQDERAIDYRAFKPDCPTLFVLGNEVLGLSRALRDACDELVEIPMRGAVVRQTHHPRNMGRGKESLNVAVAAGIVLFSAMSD